MPLRELAREFGMSATALSRHRDRHISPSLVVLGAAPGAGGTLLERIESLMGRTERILLAAELGGRGAQAIAVAAQLGRLLELWSKAKGGQDPVGHAPGTAKRNRLSRTRDALSLARADGRR